jgi:hypothetical protein
VNGEEDRETKDRHKDDYFVGRAKQLLLLNLLKAIVAFPTSLFVGSLIFVLR